jgi:hypothetical protein
MPDGSPTKAVETSRDQDESGAALTGGFESMTDIWVVVREQEGEESAYVGPFTSREEAEEWADEQKRQGRTIHDIHRMDMPIGPAQ